MSSGNFACWAMKAGDFRASEHAGDLTGLTAALAYAASGTTGDGVVSVFNSTITPVAIPTIPANVQLTVNEGGIRKTYSSGSLFPASPPATQISGTQPAGNPTRYHFDPPWVNVREYGAKGDGVTDDQPAIMAAYNALPPTGGIMYFPNGDYLINSTLTIAKTIIMQGTSHNNVQATPAPCRILHGNLNFVGILITGACCQIRRINLQGLASAVGVGIKIQNNSCCLEDVMVSGMGGTGIVLGEIGAASILNINHWQMIRVISRGNFGDGVHMEAFDSGGAANCNAGTAINLLCYQNNSKGLRLVKAGKNTFIGLTCESNGQEGIYCEVGADSNIFIGGDQENNNAGAANPQVKVADGACDDNVFFHVGSLSSAVNEGMDLWPAGGASRSMLYCPTKMHMPHVVDGTGEAITNGPAGANDIGNVVQGYFQSFWNNSGERLRVGINWNDQLPTPAGPFDPLDVGSSPTAMVMQNMADQQLNIVSRKASTGSIKLWAGATFERWMRLSNTVLSTNAQLDVVGGAEIRVAGNAVVRGRGAAITDLVPGTATASDCATAINLILARLRSTTGHGLIT